MKAPSPPVMAQKTSMSGTPIRGLITTQQTPATPRVQAVAGKHATQHDMAAMLSPSIGPMQGTQSAATPNGPKQRQKAIHMTIKPIKRSTQVKALSSAANWSKNLPGLIVPMRKSPNVKPEHNHDDGAVHMPMVPALFRPSTVAVKLPLFRLLLFS